MPPLDRAVALAEGEHTAVRQAENLDFHVVRALDIALDQDLRRAEEPLRARPGRLERRPETGLVLGHAHADPAATCRRLDHDGVADPDRLGEGRGHVRGWLPAARRHRHPGPLHQVPGPDLVAHLLDGRRVRADPDQAGGHDPAGEVRVLGEKAVTRVHGRGAGLTSRVEDGRGIEVTLRRRRRADVYGLVRLADVRQVRVGVGVHGDGPDSHPPGRPYHPPGDLTAIGDKHRIKHHASLLGYRQPLEGWRLERATKEGSALKAPRRRARQHRSHLDDGPSVHDPAEGLDRVRVIFAGRT